MLLFASILALFQNAPAPAAPQAPQTPPASEAGESEWHLVNGIRLIVNEEAVTARDFTRELLRRNQPTTTRADRDRQAAEVGQAIVERLLTIQAGKDLGFDEEMIERFVRDDLQQKVDRAGSVVELGATLEAVDLDPQTVRENTRADAYGYLWQNSVYGRGAGPGGRPHVDRFVRPGRLLFEFRRGDPRRLVPSMVTMAELDVDVARAGGAEKAKELMQSLTARLEQGEDIVKLGAELETAKIGTLNPWEPRELGPMQQSELFAEFTREPKVGKVSAPLPLRPRGELEGYALLQILKLEIPDAPLFESGEIQQRLRSRVETRQQALRRERELTKLLGAAYVWPPEAFGRESAAPEGDD